MNIDRLNEYNVLCKILLHNQEINFKDIRIELLNEFKSNLVSSSTKESKMDVITIYLEELGFCMVCLQQVFNVGEIQPIDIPRKTLLELFYLIYRYCAVFNINIFDIASKTCFQLIQIPTYYLNEDFENEDSNENETKIEKIVWAGNASQLGYILYELTLKGYIEIPKTRGNISYSKFGRICLEHFEINTTPEYIAKQVNPDAPFGLGQNNQERFKIPHITELE